MPPVRSWHVSKGLYRFHLLYYTLPNSIQKCSRASKDLLPELPRFAEAFAQGGADVVLGSRMSDHKGMPLVRYCTNRYMSWLLSRRLGQRATDTQCGYRLLSRKAIPVVLAGGASGFAADSEQLLLLARAGFRFREVPVSTVYGNERSKIHPVRDTLRFFAMLRKYR